MRRPPRPTLFPFTAPFRSAARVVRLRLDPRDQALDREPDQEGDRHVEDADAPLRCRIGRCAQDRKSTRLNSSHANISYAVFCLKNKNARFVLLLALPTATL